MFGRFSIEYAFYRCGVEASDFACRILALSAGRVLAPAFCNLIQNNACSLLYVHMVERAVLSKWTIEKTRALGLPDTSAQIPI